MSGMTISRLSSGIGSFAEMSSTAEIKTVKTGLIPRSNYPRPGNAAGLRIS